MNYNKKNKTSKGFITSIVLVSIAVILTSTFIILKFTRKPDKVKTENNKQEDIVKEENNEDEDIDFDEMFKDSDETDENLSDDVIEENEDTEALNATTNKMALEYVPKPGMILEYMHYYTDGTEGEERELIGNMDPGILVSKAILLEEYDEVLEIRHFVEGAEGIFLVYNDNPEDYSLWLPNNPKVDDTWKDIYSEHKIMDMGVSIDVGGRLFENCIMKKTTTDIVEFVNISYIAPGYGEVYSVYGGGAVEFELIGEETDEFDLFDDITRGKMMYLDGILRHKDK